MGYKDLRGWMEEVRMGQLKRIEGADWVLEIGIRVDPFVKTVGSRFLRWFNLPS